jgi:hypothetical protein
MDIRTHNSMYQVRELAELKVSFTGIQVWLPDYQ